MLREDGSAADRELMSLLYRARAGEVRWAGLALGGHSDVVRCRLLWIRPGERPGGFV
jgi:hypothetical protein